jgi:mannose-6-phosphate isomerase-like protein (cupin superfamily)
MEQRAVFQFGPTAAFAGPDGTISAETIGQDFWTRRVLEFGDGQLISRMTTASDWQTWEMHPNGDEFITQICGEMELVIEGLETPVRLVAGSFVVVPKAHWHTANCIAVGDAIYITNGRQTQHRPR